MLCPGIRIRPRHVADLLGLGPRIARSFLDLAVCRVPTRSYRRSRSDDVTRSDDPGGLGRLSFGYFSRQSAQLVGWVFRAAWVRPGGDPGPFDRCLLLTDVVFKDEAPSLGKRRIVVSHAMRERSVSRRACSLR
jgi:hypothetical protein